MIVAAVAAITAASVSSVRRLFSPIRALSLVFDSFSFDAQQFRRTKHLAG